MYIGQISLPPDGDTFVVLPGEDVTIAWKLDVSVTDVSGRWWAFLPKANDTFASIVRDGKVDVKPQYSPGPFTITKPSTLILKNVTIQYNGTYTFTIYANGIVTMSHVTVFVAGRCRLYIMLYITFYPTFSGINKFLYSDWFKQVENCKTKRHIICVNSGP